MTGFDSFDRSPRVPPPTRPAASPPPPPRRRRSWWRRLLMALLVIGLGIVVLGVVGLFVFGPPMVVEPGTWVEVRFSPTYPDARPDRTGLRAALEPTVVSHQEVLDALERAHDDPRVTGVLLRAEGFAGAWAQANELREAIGRLRSRGKRVIAYANGLGTIDAHLASASERTVVSPEAVLLIGGVKADLLYLRRALDRIGVEVESVGVGEYKSAPEQFTADGSSAASREQIEALLDDVFETWSETMATARGITRTRWNMLVDRGLFDAEQALGLGLVDEVEDLEGLWMELGDPPVLGVLDYLIAAGRADGVDDATRIAIVHVTGTIVPGRSGDAAVGGAVAGAETVVERLEEAREDDRVRAVVLRVDSPGGSALASDLILRAVDRLRARKPVVVSMGGTAASGGYYVAMNADRIVADALSVTGSIGVFVLRPNVAGTYEELDITVERFQRGPNAGLFDVNRPWTPGQRAAVQELLDRFYDRFVARVAQGRGLDLDAAEAAAGGRVWSGRRALAAGLVDTLATRRDAIRIAADLAGIPASTRPRIVTFQPDPTVLDRALANLVLGDGTRGSWRAALGPWAEVVAGAHEFAALADGRPQYAMPWRLRVR